jgi:hypothetical protein
LIRLKALLLLQQLLQVQHYQLEQGPEVRAAAAAAAAVQALPAVKQQHNLNWVTDYQLVSQ